jgi:hypothetical protein
VRHIQYYVVGLKGLIGKILLDTSADSKTETVLAGKLIKEGPDPSRPIRLVCLCRCPGPTHTGLPLLELREAAANAFDAMYTCCWHHTTTCYNQLHCPMNGPSLY